MESGAKGAGIGNLLAQGGRARPPRIREGRESAGSAQMGLARLDRARHGSNSTPANSRGSGIQWLSGWQRGSGMLAPRMGEFDPRELARVEQNKILYEHTSDGSKWKSYFS